jgi:hypothetical protein
MVFGRSDACIEAVHVLDDGKFELEYEGSLIR